MNPFMKNFGIMRRWLSSVVDRKAAKQEIDEELRFHIDQRTAENIAVGMSSEEAAREARKRFGNLQSVREQCRDFRRANFGETLAQDARFGLRMLRKNPGFATAAVLTLAIGIGANTAIFSVINGILFRPLPFPEPDRIVMLWGNSSTLIVGTQELPAEALDLPEWRAQTRSFEQIAAFRPSQADISGEGEPERLPGVQVTGNLFLLLGTKPMLGRTFTAEEEQPGTDKVAVISHALWMRRFGGDTNLLGQSITINGERRTVVGIMPPGFSFPPGAEMPSLYNFLPLPELWLPLAEPSDFWHHDENRVNRTLIAIARIKSNVTLAQAQSEMNALAMRQAREHPTSHAGWTIALRPLPLQVAGGTRAILFLLFGVVTLVLLIACANVASLLLCRSTARRREMAVRAAVGAGRGRIIRQLLTESLVLSILGGALGLLFAVWAIRLLPSFSPPGIPPLDEITVDGHLLAFTAIIALITGVSFGLVPAWSGSGIDLTRSLTANSRIGMAADRHSVHRLLVVGEVALAVILLTGAGLMIKSFMRLRTVEPGFDPSRVAAFELKLTGERYENETRVRQFFHEAREKLAHLAGVRSVAAVAHLPLGASVEITGLIVEGRPLPTPAARVPTQIQVVTPGYFATMGITLLRGRDFTEEDTANAPLVCIINETLARSAFRGVDPLGKRIRLGDGTPDEVNNPFLSIIGVARDVRGIALEVQPNPEVYFPLGVVQRKAMTFTVRAEAAGFTTLEKAVRAQMKSIDPALPVANYCAMEGLVSNALARPRFSTLLFGLFAAIALMLTIVGVYGVVAFGAAQRTREIGIRIALGARPRSILGLIIGQGMLPVLAGLGAGLAGALGLTRFMSNQLYEVKAADLATFGAVAVILLTTALLACWLPARRAAKVDPMTALRYE
jgi:putative ABC transport system permease protein